MASNFGDVVILFAVWLPVLSAVTAFVLFLGTGIMHFEAMTANQPSVAEFATAA